MLFLHEQFGCLQYKLQLHVESMPHLISQLEYPGSESGSGDDSEAETQEGSQDEKSASSEEEEEAEGEDEEDAEDIEAEEAESPRRIAGMAR